LTDFDHLLSPANFDQIFPSFTFNFKQILVPFWPTSVHLWSVTVYVTMSIKNSFCGNITRAETDTKRTSAFQGKALQYISMHFPRGTPISSCNKTKPIRKSLYWTSFENRSSYPKYKTEQRNLCFLFVR
jgi:hypothetical protein